MRISRKNRKQKSSRKRSSTFSLEPLEARELLVWAPGCGCDVQGSDGASNSMMSSAISPLEFNGDTVMIGANHGKPVSEIFNYWSGARSAIVSVDVGGSGNYVESHTLSFSGSENPNDEFSTAVLLPLEDASINFTNLIKETDYDIKVTFFAETDPYQPGIQSIGVQTNDRFTRLQNRTNSVFGVGWANDDFSFLVSDGNDLFWRRDEGETAKFTGSNNVFNTQEIQGTFTYDPVADTYTYDDEFGDQRTYSRVLDGQDTPITSDPRYLLASINDGVGNVTDYVYGDSNTSDADTAKDDLFTITDAFNRVTDYDYAAFGGNWRLSGIEDFAGRITSYDYFTTTAHSGFLKSISLPSVQDETGQNTITPITSYTYTAAGKLDTITNPQGVFTYRYDSNDRLIAQIDYDGSVTTFDTMVGGALKSISEIVDGPLNEPSGFTTETNGRGYGTRTVRNLSGLVIQEIDPLENVTTIDRGGSDLVTGISREVSVNGTLVTATTQYTVDPQNFTLDGMSFLNNLDHNSPTYDEIVFGPRNNQSNPSHYRDELNRQVDLTYFPVSDNGGNSDNLSTLVKTRTIVMPGADNIVYEYAYTDGSGTLPSGLMTKFIDPNGNETVYEYFDNVNDPKTHGRLKKITTPEVNNETEVVEFTYAVTAAQTVVTRTDELGRVSKKHYDALDRLVKTETPDPLATVGSTPTTTTTYRYDGAGNLRFVTDARQNITEYEYDGKNRVILIRDADPDGISGSEYQSPVTRFSYDAAGNLISEIDPEGRMTSYQYDALNRLIAIIEPDIDGSVANPHQNPARLLDVNADGRVDSDDGLMIDAFKNYGTLPPLSLDELPVFAANVHADELSSPSVLTDTVLYLDINGDGSVTDGDLTYWNIFFGAGINPPLTYPYGGNATHRPLTLFEYDPSGNLLSRTNARGHKTTFDNDIRGRRVSETSPSVTDANGNWTFATTLYHYDAASQMVGVTDPLLRRTDYQFDAAGRLIAELGPRVDGASSYDWQNELNPFDVDDDGEVNEDDELVLEIELLHGNGGVLGPYQSGNDYLDVNGDGSLTQSDMDTWDDYFTNRIINSEMMGNRPVTRYEYDNVGNTRFVVDPLFRVNEFQYDERNRLTYEIGENPTSVSNLFESVMDPSTVTGTRPVYHYEYDAANRMSSMVDPLSFETTYGYDELDRRTSVTLPDADGDPFLTPDDQPVMHYRYDLVGNLDQVTDAEFHVTNYHFDALNRITKIEQPFVDLAISPENPAGGVSTRPVTEYKFDDSGRTTLVIDPVGAETAHLYDGLGRLSQQVMAHPVSGLALDGSGVPISGAPYELFTYDAVGNTVRQQDSEGVASSYYEEWTFDALNRVTKSSNRQFGSSPAVDSTSYEYDLAGNRTALVDPSLNTTEWAFNGLNLPTTEENVSGEVRTFEYDLVGNQLSREDRNDRFTTYEFDNLNRFVGESWYADKSSQALLRDFQFEFDLGGQLQLSTDGDYTYDYDYDRLNRLTDHEYDIDGLKQSFGLIDLSFGYDRSGNQTRIEALVNGTLDYRNDITFDGLNRMTSVTQQAADTSGNNNGNLVAEKFIQLGYDLAGQFDYISRYIGLTTSGKAIGLTDFTYDKTGRMTEKMHYEGNSISTLDVINGYSYTFDLANRVKSMAVENPVYADESISIYDYNRRDELTDASYQNSSYDESYEYDENGNRLSADNENGDHDYNSPTSGTYVNNVLKDDGVYGYTHDNEGNRLTRTAHPGSLSDPEVVPYTEFEWDHRNRLTSVTNYTGNGGTQTQLVSYTYDDANQLLSRTVDDGAVSTRYFVHQDGQIVLQFDGDGTTSELSHRYVWGPEVDQSLSDEQLDTPGESGEVIWALTDHQGTVRDLAAYSDHSLADGTVVWKHRRYDSFGNIQEEINRGDLDGDQDLDIDDVLALYDAVYNDIIQGEPDLNGDGDFDGDDIQILIEDVIRTVLGDVDLNGSGSDGLDAVIGNWNATNAGWDGGDFNGDGTTNSGDLNIVLGNWGQSVPAANTEIVEYLFGYTGRMFDDATGLQNNLNRWYDPKVGRWISEDPIGFAAGDSNIYRYVGNSPTNATDPTGLHDGNYVPPVEQHFDGSGYSGGHRREIWVLLGHTYISVVDDKGNRTNLQFGDKFDLNGDGSNYSVDHGHVPLSLPVYSEESTEDANEELINHYKDPPDDSWPYIVPINVCWTRTLIDFGIGKPSRPDSAVQGPPPTAGFPYEGPR